MSAGDLRAAVEAVEIVSTTAFRCAGREFTAPAAPAAQPPLLDPLQTALYTECYARGAAPPSAAGEADDLTAALSAANPGTGRWVEGWSVVQVLPDGRTGLQRGATVRYAEAGAAVGEDGGAPRPGGRAATFHPHERADVPGGFYYAFGTTPHDPGELSPLVRMYWNVRPEGGPALLRALGGALERFGVPFILKCLNQRSLYPRTDAAVLYVGRRHHRLACELAAGVHARVADALDDGVPLFTKRLAPGLGLAEDPGGGQSFGMHRCRLVAEGLWNAWSAGRSAPDDRLAAVVDRFSLAGLDAERPWLNPGSLDLYRLPDHA